MAQTMVGGAVPGLVVLGSIREQTEQARGSKPASNTLHGLCISSCFLTCLSSSPDFLWWWTAMWKCKLDKPFPPQLASWSWCLCRNRNPKTQIIFFNFTCWLLCLCLWMCITCVPGIWGSQKRAMDPWNWSYRQSWATMWELGTKPWSLARETNALLLSHLFSLEALS